MLKEKNNNTKRFNNTNDVGNVILSPNNHFRPVTADEINNADSMYLESDREDNTNSSYNYISSMRTEAEFLEKQDNNNLVGVGENLTKNPEKTKVDQLLAFKAKSINGEDASTREAVSDSDAEDGSSNFNDVASTEYAANSDEISESKSSLALELSVEPSNNLVIVTDNNENDEKEVPGEMVKEDAVAQDLKKVVSDPSSTKESRLGILAHGARKYLEGAQGAIKKSKKITEKLTTAAVAKFSGEPGKRSPSRKPNFIGDWLFSAVMKLIVLLLLAVVMIAVIRRFPALQAVTVGVSLPQGAMILMMVLTAVLLYRSNFVNKAFVGLKDLFSKTTTLLFAGKTSPVSSKDIKQKNTATDKQAAFYGNAAEKSIESTQDKKPNQGSDNFSWASR